MTANKYGFLNSPILGIFLVFIVFALFLGQIRQYPGYPGIVGLHVNVINTDHHKNEDVRIQATIFDVCGYAVTPKFDVSKDHPVSQSLFMYPDSSYGSYVQPGLYPAKVSLSQEGRQIDSRYIYVYVS